MEMVALSCLSEALRSLEIQGGVFRHPPIAPRDGAPAYPPADIEWTVNSTPVHFAFNRYGRLGACFFIN